MRAFVFESATSTKSLAVLECQSLGAEKAVVPGHVKLSSLKPKMVLRPATAEGKPDISKPGLAIVSINQGSPGSPSMIHFQSRPGAGERPQPAKKQKEDDQSK